MMFYIPTSSLNFDNVLSSESIAPAAFYPERKFGYKSFELVEGINYYHKTVLMSKLPYFQITDANRENYPMIIEIDIPASQYVLYDINPLISGQDFEIWTASQTIYITPLTCKFFFLHGSALLSIKPKLADSLTLKTGKFYHIDIAPENNQFIWKNSYLPNDEINQTQHKISESIARDVILNRVKGFWFAYIGGLLQSVSYDVAKFRKICREFYNITSSIINDINRIPFSFIERLNSLKSEFYALDPNRILLNKLFRHLHPNPEVNEVVKYYGESWLKAKILEKEKIDLYKFPNFSNILSKLEWENVRDAVRRNAREFNTTTLFDFMKIKATLKCVTTDNNGLTEFRLPYLAEKQNDLFRSLLNDFFFCNDGVTIERVRTDKKDLGNEITRKIKLQYDDNEWIEYHKKYFTELRENIARATYFDVASTNDIIEQSIAAFLLKGDDLGSLREYLEDNGIGDLSFAYGFWGAALGFANIPRTLTYELFSNDVESNYFYKHIFYQVHGIELEGSIESKLESKLETQFSPINLTADPHTKSPHETVIVVNRLQDEEMIKQKLKVFKFNDAQIISISSIWRNNNYLFNDRFFIQLKRVDGLGVKKIEKIKTAFGYKDTIRQQSNLLQHIQHDSYSEFHNDPNVFYYVKDLLPKEQKIQSEFEKDIKWFQNNLHQPQTDNYAAIAEYHKFLISRRETKISKHGKPLDWVCEIYSQINIDEIVSRLKRIYLK